MSASNSISDPQELSIASYPHRSQVNRKKKTDTLRGKFKDLTAVTVWHWQIESGIYFFIYIFICLCIFLVYMIAFPNSSEYQLILETTHGYFPTFHYSYTLSLVKKTVFWEGGMWVIISALGDALREKMTNLHFVQSA
jgi:hypothetical protein